MAKAFLGINPESESKKIVEFVRSTVRAASAGGAIVGLSGGIDSAVVGALCVKALGRERVLCILMPSDHTPREDTEDAEALAARWGVRTVRVNVSGIVDTISDSSGLEGTKLAQANLEARARMALLYYYANTLGYLVAGTGDRSESLVGFFTKGGDGMVDFLPIAHLYKTQVRTLGKHLGLPDGIVTKPASPQLWPGHKASDELPADYDKLDVVLHYLFDRRASPAEAAAEAGVPKRVAEAALLMHRKSAHKRAMPPSLA